MATQEVQVNVPVLEKTHFEFDEVPIGRGGFGTVYRAKHKDYGIVAVKTLIDNGMLPQKHIRVLTKEARKLAQVCGHPSILKLLGTIMEKDNYSLILEYMALGSIVEFRKEFKVQWPVLSRILTDIASGMEYLHSHDPQILHLDLKGDNILLNGQIRAKIADFGLSEWRTITMTVTRGTEASSGRRCTVSHVPPEVWSNVNLPSSTHFDIYGFGIVLWEMLSDGLLYRGASDDLIRSAVLSGQRPDTSQIPKDCCPKFMQLMTRCWHQKPAQRPAFTVIKRDVDAIYSDLYEKDIVKALKNIRSEIVADYKHDDPVYTQTADIDNMQIPTFVLPKLPVASKQEIPVCKNTSIPSTSSHSSPAVASSSKSDVNIDTTAAEEDDTPVNVKLFKVDGDLDTKERMMRKIIHNPVAMRLVHSPYAKEIFRVTDDVISDLKNPKKVERMIQSDLALQWELQFSKFDIRRELSGFNSEKLNLNNILYNQVYKDVLHHDRSSSFRSSTRYSTTGQQKRERRRDRVSETMNKNPHVGGYNSSGNYYRLKKALENPAQLRQAMKDREKGTTGSSLITIDNEIFDLMKDPYLLVGVLYQETDLLYKLSNNYPDLFLKMLQDLHGYSMYTTCSNSNQYKDRMHMMEMMRYMDKDMIHGPEDLMMMMEMAGPRMRKAMQRHPRYNMDSDEEDIPMMMREMMMMGQMNPRQMDEMRRMMGPMHRMDRERMRRREEMRKMSRTETKPKSSPEASSSSSSMQKVKKTSLDSDMLDADGPKSDSLETDAAPPPERVQGTADIVPAATAKPAVQGSATPGHAKAQGFSSVTKPSNNVISSSTHATPAVVTEGNNVSGLGSASTSSVSASVEPMDIDPFPSLITLQDSIPGQSYSSNTSLKKIHSPTSPSAASGPSTITSDSTALESVKSSASEAPGSRNTTETQGPDDITMDANPSLETVPAFTSHEKTYSRDGKTVTILDERPGCSTKITMPAEQGKNQPNIQIGNKNLMVVNQGRSKSKVPDKKQIPAKLTESTRKVTADDLDIVAENIGSSTRELAKQLKITPAAMDHIQNDYKSEGTYEVCYQMLMKWARTAVSGATVANLAQAISRIGRNDIANKLE
ncbi:uncharacterized protein LOC132559208 isoform X2 [Ylistrum balloti]|uniref:uncharacterized protein LOC132559208 isoform X2 n=1 Tax=Ylistrum balloti TaxID=509963 RepID=UPI0029058D8E|nr:uncharacterized protein LOC132559208 isoform X2 [Ylistrum balloti]